MYDQNTALQISGHNVLLAFIQGSKIFTGDSVYKADTNHHELYIKNILFFRVLTEYTKTHQFDLIYIRYPFSSPYFLNWLAHLSKIHHHCKIVIEVPTFPYHKEFKGFGNIGLAMDWWYRRFLKKYVNRIVLIGQKDELWGIKTIKITNGINSRRKVVFNHLLLSIPYLSIFYFYFFFFFCFLFFFFFFFSSLQFN